jgi:hypothetical protein
MNLKQTCYTKKRVEHVWLIAWPVGDATLLRILPWNLSSEREE